MQNYEQDLIKLILLRGKSVYKASIDGLDEPIGLMKSVLEIIMKSVHNREPKKVAAEFAVSTEFIGKLIHKVTIIKSAAQIIYKNIQSPPSDNLISKIQFLYKTGQKVEQIAKGLSITVVRVKVALTAAEYEFIFANRSIAQIRNDFPYLQFDPWFSPYLGIPVDSMRQVTEYYLKQEPNQISSARPTPLKFVLFDMFITGMEIDQISHRTLVPVDDIDQVFADAELRNFMDTDVYSSDEAQLDLKSRPRKRLARKRQVETLNDLIANGDLNLPKLSIHRGKSIKNVINEAKETSKLRFKSHKFPFRYSAMIKPEHKWRLIVRDSVIISRIMTFAKKGKRFDDIAKDLGLTRQIIKSLIIDLSDVNDLT